MERNCFKTWLLPGVVSLSIAVLAGCTSPGGNAAGGSTASGGTADLSKDSGEKVTVELLKDAPVLPQFTVTDIDGKKMSSADWKGKVVLVNFWATWCGPCRAEIPDLVALQEKYRDHVIVIGISEDEGPVDAVRKFASDYKVNYPIAMTNPELEKLFPGIIALPTTFVLDKDGKMAQKHVGLLRARETEAAARLLAGLEVNADVKRVEDPAKINSEDVAQIKDIPGVDLSKVPDTKRAAVLQALNTDSCTCGCGLTVAKCRMDDPSCTVSPPIAKAVVERVLAAK